MSSLKRYPCTFIHFYFEHNVTPHRLPLSLRATQHARYASPRLHIILTTLATSTPHPTGTSLIRNSPPLGHYSKALPRALRWSSGGGLLLLISEVPL